MRQSTWFHRHSSISQASGYGCACELSASSSGTQPESAHLNDPRPISESPPRHHAALGTLPCSVPRERHPPHWHHRLGQDVSRIRIALQSTPHGLLGFRPRTLVLSPSLNRTLPLHRGPSGPVPAQAQERRCVFAPGPLKRAAVLLIHTAVPTPGPAHARFMATP